MWREKNLFFFIEVKNLNQLRFKNNLTYMLFIDLNCFEPGRNHA